MQTNKISQANFNAKEHFHYPEILSLRGTESASELNPSRPEHFAALKQPFDRVYYIFRFKHFLIGCNDAH